MAHLGNGIIKINYWLIIFLWKGVPTWQLQCHGNASKNANWSPEGRFSHLIPQLVNMIKHSFQIGCVQTICPRHLRRAVWRLQGLSLMNSWKHFQHQAGMFSSMIWIPNRVTITTNKWDGAQVGVSIYLILSWFDNRVDLNTSITDTSRQTLFDFICNFFTTSAQPQAWMPCSSTNSGHLISTSTTQGQAKYLC